MSSRRRSALRALYDQDQRRDILFPDTRREVTPLVVRHVDLSGDGEGIVIHSQLGADNAVAAIDEQVRYFERLQQAFEWKLFDYDRPPDLKARLAARGFTVEDPEAVLVLPLAEAPAVLWQPSNHDVRRIETPGRLGDVRAVEEAVWDEDFGWLITFLAKMLRRHPEQMSIYAAYVDGQPASAAWTFFPAGSRFASLWGGSTISRFRRRGLYTALLSARAGEARDRGVHFLTVDAGPMSRPLLEKFGFLKIAHSYACKWRVATDAEAA